MHKEEKGKFVYANQNTNGKGMYIDVGAPFSKVLEQLHTFKQVWYPIIVNETTFVLNVRHMCKMLIQNFGLQLDI